MEIKTNEKLSNSELFICFNENYDNLDMKLKDVLKNYIKEEDLPKYEGKCFKRYNDTYNTSNYTYNLRIKNGILLTDKLKVSSNFGSKMNSLRFYLDKNHVLPLRDQDSFLEENEVMDIAKDFNRLVDDANIFVNSMFEQYEKFESLSSEAYEKLNLEEVNLNLSDLNRKQSHSFSLCKDDVINFNYNDLNKTLQEIYNGDEINSNEYKVLEIQNKYEGKVLISLKTIGYNKHLSFKKAISLNKNGFIIKEIDFCRGNDGSFGIYYYFGETEVFNGILMKKHKAISPYFDVLSELAYALIDRKDFEFVESVLKID